MKTQHNVELAKTARQNIKWASLVASSHKDEFTETRNSQWFTKGHEDLVRSHFLPNWAACVFSSHSATKGASPCPFFLNRYNRQHDINKHKHADKRPVLLWQCWEMILHGPIKYRPSFRVWKVKLIWKRLKTAFVIMARRGRASGCKKNEMSEGV